MVRKTGLPLAMMHTHSDLTTRMKIEEDAARDLGKVLTTYQANRTPENKTAYLKALDEFSKLVTGRKIA